MLESIKKAAARLEEAAVQEKARSLAWEAAEAKKRLNALWAKKAREAERRIETSKAPIKKELRGIESQISSLSSELRRENKNVEALTGRIFDLAGQIRAISSELFEELVAELPEVEGAQAIEPKQGPFALVEALEAALNKRAKLRTSINMLGRRRSELKAHKSELEARLHEINESMGQEVKRVLYSDPEIQEAITRYRRAREAAEEAAKRATGQPIIKVGQPKVTLGEVARIKTKEVK